MIMIKNESVMNNHTVHPIKIKHGQMCFLKTDQIKVYHICTHQKGWSGSIQSFIVCLLLITWILAYFIQVTISCKFQAKSKNKTIKKCHRSLTSKFYSNFIIIFVNLKSQKLKLLFMFCICDLHEIPHFYAHFSFFPWRRF